MMLFHYDLFVENHIAEATDESTAHYVRSQAIGVFESEVESCERNEGDLRDVGEVSAELKSRLLIAEKPDVEGQTYGAVHPSTRHVASFGEVKEDDEDDGDIVSIHCSVSDARHDLDYLCY